MATASEAAAIVLKTDKCNEGNEKIYRDKMLLRHDEQQTQSHSKKKSSSVNFSKQIHESANHSMSHDMDAIPLANNHHNNLKKMSRLSGFFTESRVEKKSIKLPKCELSRGIIMAIIFFFLFCILIIWFIFSKY